MANIAQIKNSLPADCLNMTSLQPENLEELKNTLKSRTSYYEEEIAKMESVFLKLGLVDDRLQMCEEVTEIVEKLSQIQHKFNTKELTTNAVALSHADRLRKSNKYLSKIKLAIAMYVNLNNAVTNKIEELKCVYEHSKNKLGKIVTSSPDEIKIMEKKIGKYEHELTKLENKFPWLKNPSYDLINISKEISLLNAARQQKEELIRELSHFEGLKPDLQEAKQQVSQLKVEYEAMNKKLLEENN